MTDDRRPLGDNRTVFRPSPLAAASGAPVAPAAPFDAAALGPAQVTAPTPKSMQGTRPAFVADDVPPLDHPPRVRNSVMAAAARLLTLAAAVQAERQVPDPAGLLRTASGEARAFEKTLIELGLSAEDNARARYAVLATVDDIVQNLPGGLNSNWAQHSLVVQSFGQAFGGDQFWTILDNMLARPAAYRDLLELYQACLAVGFQGRYRIMPDAGAQLSGRMAATFAALDGIPKRPETDLVPTWRGVPTAAGRLGWLPRFLLIAAATAAALLVVFMGLRLWLGASDGAAWTALRRVPPAALSTIDRGGAGVAAAESQQLVRIRDRLTNSCIQALDDGATVRLVVSACPGLPGGMFERGAATLADPYRALLAQAGRALAPEPGQITVAAHTDSDPISGLLATSYPDNAALSASRARDAAGVLAPVVGNAGRLSPVGRGDREPVDRGDGDAAKARNRRVELIIPRSGP